MSVDKTLKTQLKDYDVQEVAPKIYKINEYHRLRHGRRRL